MPGRPYGAGVVQLVPPSVLSPVHAAAERAVAGEATGAVTQQRSLSCHLHHPERAERPVAGQRAGAGQWVVPRRLGDAERVARGPEVLGGDARDDGGAAYLGADVSAPPPSALLSDGPELGRGHLEGGAQELALARAGSVASIYGQTTVCAVQSAG